METQTFDPGEATLNQLGARREHAPPFGPSDGTRHSHAYAEFFDDEDDRVGPIDTDDDSFEHSAAFDGLKLRVHSQRFRSGRVTAVLSGVTIDLRDAALSADGATLDVNSALSGIDILVPSDWEVVCDIDAVLGGVDGGDSRESVAHGVRPRLRVTGTVVAGGLCVR
jgi:Cell wall-active antibiotics response 4TMS YvqF